jgi:hypothetical protein
MYVRKHRGPDGVLRLRAAHLPTVYEMTAEESETHKAMKDFVARTVQAAGLEAHVEQATKTRSSRPDVTVTGGGRDLGCEAQYYNASPGTILRRSKAHAEAGLTANWITHDASFHLIDRSNWMLTNKVTWRQINNAADLPLVGGYRVLAEWRCDADAQRACPDGPTKTGCGKVHLQWDTPRRLDSEATGWTSGGRTLIGAATGVVAPLFVPSRKDRRTGSHLWVPAAERDRWIEYRGGEDLPPARDDDPDSAIQFSGQDADLTCRFGEETWTPSAPLKQRGIASVELSMTVDTAPAVEERPVAARLVAPAIPRPVPGVCDTGRPKCGQPAQLYPAGWRCPEHRPTSYWLAR